MAEKATKVKATPSNNLAGMTYKTLPVNSTKRKGAEDLMFDKEAKKIIAQVFRIIENVSRKDINTWKSASQAARQIMFPNRVALYDLFTWPLGLDPHIQFLHRKLFMFLASAEYQWIDKDGEVDGDTTDLLHKSWFKDILNKDCLMWRYIETPFQGFTVMQLNSCDPATGTVDFQMIPRKHIVPEHGAWVKYQSTTGYNYYRDTPDMDWLIEMGYKYDLGWLDNLAPILIYKRNAMTFWAEFGESYGMPIAHAQTSSRDPQKKNELENWLKKFGSKKYLITDLADKLTLLENHMGDAGEKVYKMQIEEYDNQMTMQVLLQVMSSSVGKNGSRAQAQVHQDEGDEVRIAMRDSFAQYNTETIGPFLEKHGMKKKPGGHFQFIGQKKVDPNRLMADEFILSLFDFDSDEEACAYINATYGVPVTKRKPEPTIDPDDPFEDDDKPTGGKTAKPKDPAARIRKMHAKIFAAYNHAH